MATHIDIRGIICRKTKEAVDEVYLKFFVDGEQERDGWPVQSMDDGDQRSITRSFSFNNSFRAELWEDDPGDRDDHIDDLSLQNVDTEGVNEDRSHDLEGHRAEYTILYTLNYPGSAERQCYLDLVALRCDDAQERTDEPYLMMNASNVWGPSSMQTNDEEDLRNLASVPFTSGNTARVELWERDGSVSDRFGVLTIDENQAEAWAALPRTDPPVQHTFHRDRGIPGDATYRLSFRVECRTIIPGEAPE